MKVRVFNKETLELKNAEIIDFINQRVGFYLNDEEIEYIPFSKVRMDEFVGQCDCEGKEIYEGDRVEFKKYDCNGKIKIYSGLVSWMGGTQNAYGVMCEGYDIRLMNCQAVKVVGNVYECYGVK